jgi:hypothetical protein
MPETKTYTGGCHCGRVRYEVATDLAVVIECNCSHCSKRGLLLTFVTPDKFKSVAGDDGLMDYQFNKKMIHHLMCPDCGIESFARGTAPNGQEMVAINVRCLDDVDLKELSPVPFDGRNS